MYSQVHFVETVVGDSYRPHVAIDKHLGKYSNLVSRNGNFILLEFG